MVEREERTLCRGFLSLVVEGEAASIWEAWRAEARARAEL